MARMAMYAMIAAASLVCFMVAVIYLPQGPDKEWVALLLGPLSGICLAIIMHFGNISFKFTISFVLQDGGMSLSITKS
jgi:hypothetical protein